MSFPQLPFSGIRNRRLAIVSSDLIVPAIALTSLIGKVKPVNSDLVVTTPSISTNVSTIRFANSDLVVNPVGSSASISDIKLASSALQVSSVAISTQVSPVSLVASNLVVPPVILEVVQPSQSTQLWTLSAITTQLWLDAADSATITTVSGGVSQWNDKSGNGRNATQSTSGSRPLLDTLNGLSVLSFDGTDDCLDLNRGFFVDNNYSLFVVATPDIGTEGYLLELCNNDETKQNIIITQYASKAYEYLVIDGSLVRFTLGSPSLTGFNILSYTINGTSVNGYANGSISGSGTASMFAFEFRKIASSLFANYAQSKIAEIIVANVSTANIRQRVEGRLAHKWGLTANLPSDHPYKTTPPMMV